MNRLVVLVLALAAALLLWLGVGRARGAVGRDAAPVVKVHVDLAGGITVDGEPWRLEDLHRLLLSLEVRGAIVWFCRDEREQRPHPAAMSVLKQLCAAKVPVSLSTSSDFSDEVLRDGSSVPRAAAAD